MERELSLALAHTNHDLVTHGGVDGTFVLLAIFILTKRYTLEWGRGVPYSISDVPICSKPQGQASARSAD